MSIRLDAQLSATVGMPASLLQTVQQLGSLTQSVSEQLAIASDSLRSFTDTATQVRDWLTPDRAEELTQFMPAVKSAMNTDKATKRELRRITKGHASTFVRYQNLIVSLFDSGELETVELFSKAMQGDKESLQALQDSDLELDSYREFIAILGEIDKLQQDLAAVQLQDSLSGTAQVRTIQRPRTETKSERLPRQVLLGAVAVRAPSHVPTDTHSQGCAVGVAA